MPSKFSILLALTSAALVSAHGYINPIVIGGKSYAGPTPYQNPMDSIIRQVSGVEPVQDMASPNMACGLNAKTASLVGDALPGDTVEFHWLSGGSGQWPHLVGPMQTYMAECGGDCATVDGTTVKWFKVQQTGKLADGTWEQGNTLAKNLPAVITLPSDIKSGGYLLRHEVLSLQNGGNVGGAEFFISCSQVNVGGSGTATPTESELVSFPGAYSAEDPGIHYNPYEGNTGEYQFPGPPLAGLAARKFKHSSRGMRKARTQI